MIRLLSWLASLLLVSLPGSALADPEFLGPSKTGGEVAVAGTEGVDRRVMHIPFPLLGGYAQALQSGSTLWLVATPCDPKDRDISLELTAPLIWEKGLKVDLASLPTVHRLWRYGFRVPHSNSELTGRLIPIVPLLQTEIDGSARVRVFVPVAEALQPFGLLMEGSGVVKSVADDLDIVDGPRPKPGDLIDLTPFHGMATARCWVDFADDTPLIPLESLRGQRERGRATFELRGSGQPQIVVLRPSDSWAQSFDYAAAAAAVHDDH